MTEYPVKSVKFKSFAAQELGSMKTIRSGEVVSKIGLPAGTKFDVVLVPEMGGILVRGSHKGNTFFYHASLLDEITFEEQVAEAPEVSFGKKAAAK